VRLTAGGQTLTRELDVRLDPTIPAPEGELRTQLEINLKLRDMESAVTTRFVRSTRSRARSTRLKKPYARSIRRPPGCFPR